MAPVVAPESLAEYLAFLKTTRTAIEELEHRTVLLLREAGVTQQAIADVLGISRQALAERHNLPKKRRRRKP